MSIGFNEIASDIRVPGVQTEVDSSRALSGPQLKPMKVCMVGQRLAAGTVAQRIQKKPTTEAEARTWFGAGSMLHGMVAAYLANKHEFDLTVIALDDAGGGTAATTACVVSGPATAAGTIYFYIGGYRCTVAVANGAASTTIATALSAAINLIEGCPVTAGVASSTVTLTARHKGVASNEIDLRLNYNDGEALPAGVAITNVPGTMGATVPGAVNPTLDSNLWNALGETPFDIFVIPYTDATSNAAVTAEMESRWSPTRQIEGSCVAAKRDTYANLLTFGALTNAKLTSFLAIEGMIDPPWETAAAYGAVRSFYAKADPARPQRTLQLVGLMAPLQVDAFTPAERDVLYRTGIAATVIGPGNVVALDRTVTNYQKNAAGAADTAFLDTTTVDTLAYLRWSFRQRMLLRFSRTKLVGDGNRPGAGQAVLTPKLARAEAVALFEEWQEINLVEDADQFKRDLIVEINGSDPTRIDFVLPINIANPLYVVAAQFQFRL